MTPANRNARAIPYLDKVDFNREMIANDKYAFVSVLSTQNCPERRLGCSFKIE